MFHTVMPASLPVSCVAEALVHAFELVVNDGTCKVTYSGTVQVPVCTWRSSHVTLASLVTTDQGSRQE